MRIGSSVPRSRVDFPQDVEQLRVHARDVVVAPVAQEVVELLQAVFVVAPVALEGDGDGVVAVGVLEGDRAGVAVGDQVLQRAGGRRSVPTPQRWRCKLHATNDDESLARDASRHVYPAVNSTNRIAAQSPAANGYRSLVGMG